MVKQKTQVNLERLHREILTRLVALPLTSVENVRSVRSEFKVQTDMLSARHLIELARLFLKGNELIPRFFAYELVHYHPAAMKSLNSRNILILGKGIDSWAAVDTFACYLSGPAWREGQIADYLIRSWTRSKDRWWRRAAVVSTIALNNKARGGRGDTERTLTVCTMVIDDHDDMVVKALSWSLRELSKREPKVVRDFIVEHASRLHPRVVREVRNKLKTGLKNPKSQKGK